MSTDSPTLITEDYRRTALARAVPHAVFMAGGWYLPPNPDPDSARVALKLFPHLQAQHPELVACARLSAIDFRPIDFATEHWRERPPAADPWRRVNSILRHERYRWRAPLKRPIELHEFQRIDADYAIDRLNKGLGAYLGWEMGLGKTLGACMVIDGWAANFVLIACPNAAKQDPWQAELARFCPWLEVVVVGNGRREYDAALARATELSKANTPFALICHYEAVWRIEGENKRGWKRLGQWDLVISDEAHVYKNRKAKFTATMRRMDTVGRLNLSGSVMSGNAEDLFVPWQMFQPKRYRSQHRDWNNRFMEIIEDDYGHPTIIGPKPHRLPEFRAELGEVLVVRLAKDHLDIPEPHVIRHKCKLLPAQSVIYHQVADELLADLPDGSVLATTDGAPLVSALRRVTGGIPAPDGVGLLSGKLDAAVEVLLAAGSAQGVVFAWHKAPANELVRRLHAAGVSAATITGDVPRATRERSIDLFKRGGIQFLVATIATLSAAVNLQNASLVAMVEHSYDPVDNEQAIGRVVRQGQSANASVHHFAVEDSVDDLQVLPTATTKSELRRMVIGTC